MYPESQGAPLPERAGNATVCLITRLEAAMTPPANQAPSPHQHMLDKTRELAEEVRQTAERVHQQAQEAHRLTEIARQHSERARVLSRIGQAEARAAKASIDWSIDIALNHGTHPSLKEQG